MKKRGNTLNEKNTLARLFKFGLEFKFWFFSSIIISILLSLVSSYKPILTSEAIDLGVVKNNSFLLKTMVLWIAIFTFIEVIFQYFLTIYSNLIAQNVIYNLRMKLYHKLIHSKINFFDRMPTGILITRSVSDVETVATVFNDGILMIFGDILRIVFVIITMFYANWILAIISFMILPIMYFLIRYFQNVLKKTFTNERNASAKLNSFIQERLSGMNLIQLFNHQEIEKEKFKSINNEVTQAHLKTVFFFSLFFPVVELIASLSIGLIIFIGALMIFYRLNVSPGEIVAFIMFINMLMRPIRQIADRFNQIQQGIIGAERVLKLIDSNHYSIEDLGIESSHIIQGKITFDNVSFSYIKNEKILKGISFQINQGQTVAIIGATGSGKSTIINLINRFYEIQEGKILIDDIPIKRFKLNHLRKQIAIVLQEVFLFSESIFENIKFGNHEITLKKIEKAAKEIGIHDFIQNLPNGYYHKISERGNSLSYGQKQLISFLRAYLFNSPILILDEATSSVDTEIEELIQKTISKLTKNRTAIIIAHRLLTIKNADKIIVIHKGEIIEEGCHEELIKNKFMYYDLYHAQFSKLKFKKD